MIVSTTGRGRAVGEGLTGAGTVTAEAVAGGLKMLLVNEKGAERGTGTARTTGIGRGIETGTDIQVTVGAVATVTPAATLIATGDRGW